MMNNLFSSFDPATSTYWSTNWVGAVLPLIMIPTTFWALPNQLTFLYQGMTMMMASEFKPLIKGINQLMLIFMSLFLYIVTVNMMGLLPYVYTSSSHVLFTLSLALPMWLCLMVYGWVYNSMSMLCHLTPANTPSLLMPLMVCIEITSNLIRPGSLTVRLAANMIAGHLLITLIGNYACHSMNMAVIMAPVQMMFLLFEFAVAIIQAYVFSTLMVLYSAEST